MPLSIDDARGLVARYVDYYNIVRLHSAIGYVTPQAKLDGRQAQIFKERDRKLEAARRRRQLRCDASFRCGFHLTQPVVTPFQAEPRHLIQRPSRSLKAVSPHQCAQMCPFLHRPS
jgi:hypothetical protein